jgi:hypothetical protein
MLQDFKFSIDVVFRLLYQKMGVILFNYLVALTGFIPYQ